MATATEIATKALKRLRIISAGETPAAEDVADATDALNAMLASWEAQGLTGDVLPLDARFEAGIVAMLAVRMAEDYGKTPGPVLLDDADRGWKGIRGAFFAVPRATFDTGIQHTGSRMLAGYIIGEDPWPNSPWQPVTEYALRTFVTNGANIYECITTGTSAASGGPSGTSSTIADGTAEWCWRRVDG